MSDKKNKNPYREGAYREIFAVWKKKQVVTKAELIEFAVKELGKTTEQAHADVTVILSPRYKSDRGDCRGNISAQGHLYYAEKLPRKVVLGVKEPQKYRLRWRTNACVPRTRPVVTVNEQERTTEKQAVIVKPVSTTVTTPTTPATPEQK